MNRFGLKANGGPSFGQKIQAGASKLFHKYGDIVRNASNLGFVAGGVISGFNPAIGAEVSALSALAGKAGSGLSAIGSALEKPYNHHNRLA
jgi:hypothetical protein